MAEQTLWVIAYDIGDDETRTRVQHALERVGDRRQKSVFECRLTDRELDFVWRQLGQLIDPTADNVLAWPLTRAGHERSRAMGIADVTPYDLPGFDVV